MVWSDGDKLTPQNLNSKLNLMTYNVRDASYGATGAGLIDDAPSIQSALNSALSNALIYFPPGIYRCHFGSNGSELIAIPGNNITFLLDSGATILSTASTALSTVASERSQFVFLADGRRGITFRGGAFDGNRKASVDPCAGLFHGRQTSDVLIENMSFLSSSNNYGGTIRGDSHNGTTNVFIKNWKLKNNTVKNTAFWTDIRNSWSELEISGNYFEDMDLGNPITGRTKFGSTAYDRIIRLSGFVAATSSTGTIGGAVIANNRINRGTYGIEVWNEDTTNGRNPDFAQKIVVTGNDVHTVYGIGVNSWGNVAIGQNSIRRLSLDSTADYSGSTSIASTGAVFGIGIEARPGIGFSVTGNSVDGSWISGTLDLAGSFEGIAIGQGSGNVRCESTVAGNNVRRCYSGLKTQNTELSNVVGNSFLDCRAAVDGSQGTNTSGFSGNVFRGNLVSVSSLVPGTNCANFYGEWNVEHNTFQGDPRNLPTAAIVQLQTATARYRLHGNTFVNFTGAAVQDSGLTTTSVNNYYDGGVATSSGAGGYRVVRQNNKNNSWHNETFVRCKSAFVWNSAAASNESYIANSINLSNTSAMNVADPSGDTFNLVPGIVASYGSVAVMHNDGTALAPSVAFGSENSLGFYRSGNSGLGLSYGRFAVPSAPPANGTAAGTTGQMSWVSSGATFFYICTSTNSWVRVGMTPF